MIQVASALVLVLCVWEQLSKRTPDNVLLTVSRWALAVSAVILFSMPEHGWALSLAFCAVALKMLEKWIALNWWRFCDRRKRTIPNKPRTFRKGD